MKKFVLFGSISLFALALFYAVVCTPVYQWSSSDIAVSEIFTTVWDFVQSLVHFALFWLSASLILLSVYRFGKVRAVLLLSIGADALLNIGSLVAGLIMMRDFDMLTDDMIGVLVSIVLDACQILLFWLIAHLTVKAKNCDRIPTRSVIFSALIPTVFQIINRIVYDISYGAPTGKSDLIVMIAYYLADVASFAVGYLVILLFIDRISKERQNEIIEKSSHI